MPAPVRSISVVVLMRRAHPMARKMVWASPPTPKKPRSLRKKKPRRLQRQQSTRIWNHWPLNSQMRCQKVRPWHLLKISCSSTSPPKDCVCKLSTSRTGRCLTWAVPSSRTTPSRFCASWRPFWLAYPTASASVATPMPSPMAVVQAAIQTGSCRQTALMRHVVN